MGYAGNTGDNSNSYNYKKSYENNSNDVSQVYSKLTNPPNAMNSSSKSNQYTYYNGSSEETSKFSLSHEPIIVRMDGQSNNNMGYGPYGTLKTSEKYFNNVSLLLNY